MGSAVKSMGRVSSVGSKGIVLGGRAMPYIYPHFTLCLRNRHVAGENQRVLPSMEKATGILSLPGEERTLLRGNEGKEAKEGNGLIRSGRWKKGSREWIAISFNPISDRGE